MLKSPVSLQGGSFGLFSWIVIYHGATSPALEAKHPGVILYTLANYTIPLDITKYSLVIIYILSRSDALKNACLSLPSTQPMSNDIDS